MGDAARVAVLSDTHIRRGGARRLPSAAWDEVRRADLVLHAGDVLIPEFLDELGAVTPTVAVLGNNDTELVGVLPESVSIDVAGVRVAMIHDSGTTAGRPARMRRRFPDADVVVFGHSHAPVDVVGVDGQRLFNPGSATERRREPCHTMGILEMRDGTLCGSRILALD